MQSPSAPHAVKRVQTMYAPHLPQASDVWDELCAVEYVANARSPLVETILALRAAGVVPVCKLLQALPGNQYKIILTWAQLERIAAAHYHLPVPIDPPRAA